MRPTISVREANPADAPALALLFGELGFPAPAAVIAERLVAMQAKGEMVLVAEGPEGPIGVLTIHLTPVLHRPTPVGRFTALVVAEGNRGRGVGRALVEAGEGHITDRGCALVEVTSNRGRPEAHAFYERLGYEVTSLRFKKVLPTRSP